MHLQVIKNVGISINVVYLLDLFLKYFLVISHKIRYEERNIITSHYLAKKLLPVT